MWPGLIHEWINFPPACEMTEPPRFKITHYNRLDARQN